MCIIAEIISVENTDVIRLSVSGRARQRPDGQIALFCIHEKKIFCAVSTTYICIMCHDIEQFLSRKNCFDRILCEKVIILNNEKRHKGLVS